MKKLKPWDIKDLKSWCIADKKRAKHLLAYNKELSPKEKSDIIDYFGKDNIAMVDISGNGNHWYWGGK